MPVLDINALDVTHLDSREIFVLDANVLKWLYAGYPLPQSHKDYKKAQNFSNFVGKLLTNGNQLGASVGNVQEVLNLIERAEYDLYKNAGGLLSNKKKFREDATQRALVQKKVQAAYTAICGVCTLYDMPMKKADMDCFVADLTKHVYDPLDFFVVESIVQRGHINYITSDPDFQSDTRLNVYTIV